MATKKITKEDAFELAQKCREASVELGNFRFKNWQTLSPKERQDLENEEWDLLTISSSLLTKAVGIALEESELTVKRLKESVEQGKKVLKNIDTARNALRMAGGLLALAGAVVSKNPAAIISTAKDVFEIAKDMKPKKEEK